MVHIRTIKFWGAGLNERASKLLSASKECMVSIMYGYLIGPLRARRSLHEFHALSYARIATSLPRVTESRALEFGKNLIAYTQLIVIWLSWLNTMILHIFRVFSESQPISCRVTRRVTPMMREGNLYPERTDSGTTETTPCHTLNFDYF